METVANLLSHTFSHRLIIVHVVSQPFVSDIAIFVLKGESNSN